MLWLVTNRSGDLLRFELGPSLVSDETPGQLVGWVLDDCDARFEELWEVQPGEVHSAVVAVLPELPGDPSRLAAALRILAIFGEPADQALVEPHLADPDPRVRTAAIRSIGRLGNARRHDCLFPFLDDPDAAIRREAVVALGKFGIVEVETRLEAAAARHADLAADVAISRQRIAAMVRRDFRALRDAVVAAGEWDDLLKLILFLKRFFREAILDPERSEDERVNSLRALGLWRIRRASWAIQKVLDDPLSTPRLRLEAVRAIGWGRLASAADRLIHITSEPGNAPALREEAAIALGRIGYTRAFEPLLSLWPDAAPGLRAAIRFGLRKMARPPFREAADDPLVCAPPDADRVVRIDNDLELRAGPDPVEIRSSLHAEDPAERRAGLLLAAAFARGEDMSLLSRMATQEADPTLRELASAVRNAVKRSLSHEWPLRERESGGTDEDCG